MQFSDIKLNDVGQTIQLVAAVYAGNDGVYVLPLPSCFDEVSGATMEVVRMTNEDWIAWLRQSDLVETEVLAQAKDGTLYKAMTRKCQRVVDQQVSWNVFRRDNFMCRYCGAENLPLTVDHLVRWEDGGPSIEKNLVASCRRCNKIRGDTAYAAWLRHPYYLERAQNLSIMVRELNERVAGTLADIPRKPVVRER